MGIQERRNDDLILASGGLRGGGGTLISLKRHTFDTYLKFYVRTINKSKFHSFHFPLKTMTIRGNMADSLMTVIPVANCQTMTSLEGGMSNVPPYFYWPGVRN